MHWPDIYLALACLFVVTGSLAASGGNKKATSKERHASNTIISMVTDRKYRTVDLFGARSWTCYSLANAYNSQRKNATL